MMAGKLTRVMIRGLAVWLVIVVIESVHGTLRELFLKPLVGDVRARQIAFFTALALIFTVTFIFIRWIRASNNKQLLLVGLMWVVLMVCFEGFIVRPALNLPWSAFFADYNIFEGGVMAIGIVFLALAPFVTARLRNRG